jgi:hypothetical protein
VKAAATEAPGGWVAAATLLAAATGPALEPQRWWPALFVLAVGLVALTRRGPVDPPSGFPAVALAAAVAWATWSTASIAWAQDPAWAWEAAGRAWLVTGTLGALLLWPGTASPAQRVRGGALAVAAAAALEAVIAWAGALSGTTLGDGRLRGALPYANGLALVMVAGALAAIGLAAGARTRVGRGGATALAAALLATGLAAQSRSSLPVLLVGLLVALGCGGARRAALVATAAATGALAIAAGPVLGIRTTTLDGGDVPAAAATALLVGLAAAVLAGAVAATVRAGDPHRGARPRAGPSPWLRAMLLGGAVAAALVPVIVTIATRDSVDYTRVESATTRFAAGAASNRPDMWRVALRSVGAHPVGGVGAGSFERPYLRLRRAPVAPRFAHSLPAEAAATLGVPGVLAVLLGAGALLAGAIRATGRAELVAASSASSPAPWLAGAGAAIAAHALVDWTTELPVVALLALVALGTLTGAGGPAAATARPARRLAATRIPSRGLAGALTMATLAMLPIAAAATLAERRALDGPADVDARLSNLALAARLSPLDPRPLESRALVALRHGRPAVARRSAAQALERDPHGWFALWISGVLDADDAARRQALLRDAARQNPREEAVRLTSGAADGRPLDVDRALAALVPEG